MATKSKRKTLGSKLRFEVFKRDSFRCQYCGKAAPDVLLHVDHIKPVASGGLDELLNLVTACVDCNLGKGARHLDDDAAVEKARTQIEALQERREQLEMLLAWRDGMSDIDEIAVKSMVDHWQKLAPGWTVSDSGIQSIRKWWSSWSLNDILTAMDAAATAYIEIVEGKATSDSWSLAFSKIPGCCRVNELDKSDPNIKELYYVRGICRKRLEGRYFNNADCLWRIKQAVANGASIAAIKSIACCCRSWSGLFASIDALTEVGAE